MVNEEPRPHDLNITRQAKNDIKSTTAALKRALKGKAFPSWSVPLELWLIALDPTYISKQKFPRAGLGDQPISEVQCDLPRKAITKCLQLCYKKEILPLEACMTQGFFLAKNNGAAGIKSVRLAHLMCPLWGQLCAGALRRNAKKEKTLGQISSMLTWKGGDVKRPSLFFGRPPTAFATKGSTLSLASET